LEIEIITTGGTFSKFYNSVNGDLEINEDFNKYMNPLLKYIEYNHNIKINNMINKDSLDFSNEDRELLLNHIENSEFNNIIIIHGTDTINVSADFIEQKMKLKNKRIIFVGSMTPVSINPIEGSNNLGMAIGFLNSNMENNIYISMHGIVCKADKIIKDKSNGYFKFK
jgi:L-asparaginase